MSLAPGTRLGPYEILSLVGSGGMGEVYRARDTRLDRLVAIKVLRHGLTAGPHAAERFQREARAASALNHPNICTIYDVGADPPFLAMELLDGETLQERLRQGTLDLADVIEIGLALSDALDAAHSRGIIHRDIKPANIFLTSRGPKILDFGLAKTTVATAGVTYEPTRPAEALLTESGLTVGTVAYMSPEQLRGRDLDGRTDLFSLGLVLYEMATGRPAFQGETSAVISAAILHDEPVAPRQIRPELPARFDDLALKALEKDREDRCQTASELRSDLRRLKREIESHSKPIVIAGAVRRRASPLSPSAPAHSSDVQVVTDLVKRHRGGVAVAAVIGALAIGGVYMLNERRQPLVPSVSPTRDALEDLRVTQLTTSGNAFTPAVSPDGKYVAYVQQDGLDRSLWIRQTTTASNVRIVPAEPGRAVLAPTVTPDGSFVHFLRTNRDQPNALFELWRVPFLGGAPRRVSDRLWSPVGWSPDGHHLAFVRTDLAKGWDALVIADADGSNEQTLAMRQRPGRFYSMSLTYRPMIRPAWSPDGRLIALIGSSGQSGNEAPELVSVDVASGAQRVLPLGIPDETQVNGLAWIDAGSLVVNHASEPSAPTQLWRISYPDGRQSRLTNDVNGYVGVSVTADRTSLVTARSETRVGIWVGDGTATSATEAVPPVPFPLPHTAVAWVSDQLLYNTNVAGRVAVMSMDPEHRGIPQEILSGADTLDVTPDGRTVVFNAVGSGERAGIWKMDMDGRHPVQLATNVSGNPIVTPDGRVVFLRNRGGLQTPWIMSIDGGPATEVVRMFVNAGGLDVSPDGKSLVLLSTSNQAVVCDLPACTARRSMTIRGFPGDVHWTRDGRGIAYVCQETPANICVQPLDGTARQLTHFTDDRRIAGFAWSRDGKRLALARSAVTNDIVLFKGLRR